MAGDPIKKLADRVKNHTPTRRASKSNRTLSVSEPQYSTFLTYCKSKGLTAGEVVDNLIAMFLEEVKDDLPPDLTNTDVAS